MDVERGRNSVTPRLVDFITLNEGEWIEVERRVQVREDDQEKTSKAFLINKWMAQDSVEKFVGSMEVTGAMADEASLWLLSLNENPPENETERLASINLRLIKILNWLRPSGLDYNPLPKKFT